MPTHADTRGRILQVWRLGIHALYRACWHTRDLPLEHAHTSARSGNGSEPHPQPHPHSHPHLGGGAGGGGGVGGASVGEGLATWALEHFVLKAEANEDAVETQSSLHALAAILHLLVYLFQSLKSA
jgi:hypothetical protein